MNNLYRRFSLKQDIFRQTRCQKFDDFDERIKSKIKKKKKIKIKKNKRHDIEDPNGTIRA